MATYFSKSIIESPTDEIWQTLRSFGGVEQYVPIVKSSIVQTNGNDVQRICSVQLGEQEEKLVEKLESIDDHNKTLQILMLQAPPPFKGTRINMQVKSIDKVTSEFRVWSELTKQQGEIMQGIFQMIADGLKKFHEEKN